MRSAKPESLPDGTNRLTGKTALDACLTSLDTVCHDGYEVIHASEKRIGRTAARQPLEMTGDFRTQAFSSSCARTKSASAPRESENSRIPASPTKPALAP